MKRIIQKGKLTAIITTEGMRHFKRSVEYMTVIKEERYKVSDKINTWITW